MKLQDNINIPNSNDWDTKHDAEDLYGEDEGGYTIYDDPNDSVPDADIYSENVDDNKIDNEQKQTDHIPVDQMDDQKESSCGHMAAPDTESEFKANDDEKADSNLNLSPPIQNFMNQDHIDQNPIEQINEHQTSKTDETKYDGLSSTLRLDWIKRVPAIHRDTVNGYLRDSGYLQSSGLNVNDLIKSIILLFYFPIKSTILTTEEYFVLMEILSNQPNGVGSRTDWRRIKPCDPAQSVTSNILGIVQTNDGDVYVRFRSDIGLKREHDPYFMMYQLRIGSGRGLAVKSISETDANFEKGFDMFDDHYFAEVSKLEKFQPLNMRWIDRLETRARKEEERNRANSEDDSMALDDAPRNLSSSKRRGSL